MRLFGGALVGLVNLGAGQPAAQRQAEHLPMAVRQRERRRRVAAFAEARSVAGVQDVAQRAHALPGKLLGTDVGILKRGAAQAGERQRGAAPQLRVLAGVCDVGSEPLRRAKIGIRGRPQPVGFEFPFQELPVHQSPAGFNVAAMHGSSFAFPLRLFSIGFVIYSRKPDNTRKPPCPFSRITSRSSPARARASAARLRWAMPARARRWRYSTKTKRRRRKRRRKSADRAAKPKASRST